MIAALIENGVVVNVLEVKDLNVIPGLVELTEGGIGWSYADGTFTPPAEPDPVVVVPAQVSQRQIRQALTATGLRAGVEAAVAAGSQDLKDWWEYANPVERQHPMVIGMAAGLGVTDQQLDDLFILAGSL